MGVDASGLGIQDFAAGIDDLQDAIAADGKSTARFPHLAVNIDFSNEKDFKIGKNGEFTNKLKGTVAGYAVASINNERIGLIGVVSPYLQKLVNVGKLTVQPKNPANIEKLATIIQSAANKLELQSVNKIILLARMQLDRAKKLAKLLRGIDIIVAAGADGRSSMGDGNDEFFSSEHATDKSFSENYPFVTRNNNGDPLIVVSVDGDYKYLGRLIVSFNSDGLIQLNSLNSHIIGAYAATKKVVENINGFPNPKVVEIRDAIRNVISKHYGYILGYSNVYLDGRRSKIRTEETNLGNLTADAILWYASQLTGENVQVSLQNSGGIRTDIGTSNFVEYSSKAILLPPYAYKGENILDGGITEGHIRATLSYDNGLVVFTVTATELKDLLESGIAESGPGITSGRFPQVAGMRFSFDTTKNPRSEFGNGDRVQTLEILNRNGHIIDTLVKNGILLGNHQRTFRLVTLNYLANGGDYYPFLELSAPNRLNLYDGRGYGDKADFLNVDLMNDPGLNSEFSYTGGQQDALAEYLLVFHDHPDLAYSEEEIPANKDRRIERIR
jgi:2',3'-cyclic-nucleotide 2'-phosphodiesterase (5'-nucleotidase family)